MTCMVCGAEKVEHDCKGSYFKKNLSTDGAVKEEPKDEAPNGECSETPETARSSA